MGLVTAPKAGGTCLRKTSQPTWTLVHRDKPDILESVAVTPRRTHCQPKKGAGQRSEQPRSSEGSRAPSGFDPVQLVSPSAKVTAHHGAPPTLLWEPSNSAGETTLASSYSLSLRRLRAAGVWQNPPARDRSLHLQRGKSSEGHASEPLEAVTKL